MSNSLAISAVTATLRKILDDGIKLELAGSKVTTQPPDKANTSINLINVFLYQTVINAAWRNVDMPRQVKPGETGQPPLALNLYYLLTAYGKNDDVPDPLSHRLLGRAMSILHDHPVLSSEDIKAALPAADQQLYDLYDQVEHVRITPQPLTLDEMSKLWTTFQAKYRISTAYLVSVVLIESKRPSRTPLPVLKRGPQDQGVDAQSSLASPFPTLTEVALPENKKQQPSAQLGNTLILRGHHLDGDSLRVRFSNQRLNNPIEIGPLPAIVTSGAAEITLPLPDNAANRAAWVAGYYMASIIITRNSDPVNRTRTTNELAFSLAPRIVPPLNPLTAAAAAGDFTLRVTCSPQVRPEQRVSLLFGANEIQADPHPAQTAALTFRIRPVTPDAVGKHFVRLRIDGIDSLLVKYDETPLKFDDDQKVTIT